MATTITNKMAKERPLATEGQITVQDKTPGFFMRVGKRRKVYAWATEVIRLNKRTTLKGTLGPVEDWDATDARIEALKQMKAARRDTNGSKPGTLTLRMVWADYEKRLVKTRSPATLHNYRDSIERVLADWLDTPMLDLSDDAQGVKARHEAITRQHGRRGDDRGGEATANQAMKCLRTLYKYARDNRMEKGLPAEAPTDAVQYHDAHRRNTGMAQGDLAAWNAQRKALGNPVRRAFHLFTLLSGSRPNALRQAEWSWYDAEAATLTFPAAVMKSGKTFTMPLSGPMVECLGEARAAGRALWERHGLTYIFPSEVGCISHCRERRQKLKLFGGDLRQTWVNASKEVRLNGYEARRLLNHSAGDAHDGYADEHRVTPGLFEAQELVSAYLVEGLYKGAADVVDL